MNDVMQFVAQHWVLVLVFLGLLAILIQMEGGHQVGGVTMISPQKCVTMMNRGKVVMIDVRPKELYDQGHIIGAVNVPLAEINQDIKAVLDKTKLGKSKQDSTVIVVCKSGNQATKVAKQLTEKFTVVSLQGGMNAWVEASLPVQK